MSRGSRAYVNAHAILGRSLARRRPPEAASQPPHRGVHIDVWLPLRHARRFSRDGSRCFAGGTWMHYRATAEQTVEQVRGLEENYFSLLQKQCQAFLGSQT